MSGEREGEGVRHLDLFSGIGGFALAARWMNWETVQFVELDKFCQKVLKKHWPNVPIRPEQLRNGLNGLKEYSTMYCKRCGYVSKLNERRWPTG